MNLDTTSCRRAVGMGGMLSQRSPVASVGICCPHIYPAPPPSTSPLSSSQPVTAVPDWFTTWLSQQMAAVQQPWGTDPPVWPWGSSSLHAAPRGLTLDHDTHRDTHSVEAVQAGWVTEVETTASAHYRRTQPPSPCTHTHLQRLFGSWVILPIIMCLESKTLASGKINKFLSWEPFVSVCYIPCLKKSWYVECVRLKAKNTCIIYVKN